MPRKTKAEKQADELRTQIDTITDKLKDLGDRHITIMAGRAPTTRLHAATLEQPTGSIHDSILMTHILEAVGTTIAAAHLLMEHLAELKDAETTE